MLKKNFRIIVRCLRYIIIIMLIPIGILTLWHGMSELNSAFPTKLLCGTVVSNPNEAIEIVARNITNWESGNGDLRGTASVEEYVKKWDGCCWADIHKDLDNNWMVSITLPRRCGSSIETLYGVKVCGGASWVLGSTPTDSVLYNTKPNNSCR